MPCPFATLCPVASWFCNVSIPGPVPVVFHQVRRKWSAETSFEDLLPEEVRRWATTPGCTHVLMDQVGIAPAEVRGGYRGRIMELSLAKAFDWNMWEALPQLRQLLQQLAPQEPPDNHRGLVNSYHDLTGTEDVVEEYKQAFEDIDITLLDGTNPYDLFRPDGAKRFGPKLKKALEDARREGIKQGIKQGIEQRINTVVSRMLDQGMDWQVIEQLTGVDEARYREPARPAANEANGASD